MSTRDSYSRSSRVDEPENWPDALTDGNTIMHIHGFSVTQQGARGEHSASFKRLFHAGSNARFVGINWHGAVSPDYYGAVVNAFLTSEILDIDLQPFTSGETTILAHSLGNVLVSNAIERHGFRPDRYLVINGAVALEAYDASQLAVEDNIMEPKMRREAWNGYPERLIASRWYKVFEETGDARAFLTWRNCFGDVPYRTDMYNFYSTGENVVENPGRISNTWGSVFWNSLRGVINGWKGSGDTGRSAWVGQEISKGNSLFDPMLFDMHGGWRFVAQNASTNPKYVEPDRGGGQAGDYDVRAPDDPVIDSITNQELAEEPFFYSFSSVDLSGIIGSIRFPDYNGDVLLAPIEDTTASNMAALKTTRYKLLAEAIPAEAH